MSAPYAIANQSNPSFSRIWSIFFQSPFRPHIHDASTVVVVAGAASIDGVAVVAADVVFARCTALMTGFDVNGRKH